MNRLIDYSSRFRILKGGKISLIVSALALGSLVNVASAAYVPITISDSTTSAYSYSGNPTDVLYLTIDNGASRNVEGVNAVNVQGVNSFNFENNGEVKIIYTNSSPSTTTDSSAFTYTDNSNTIISDAGSTNNNSIWAIDNSVPTNSNYDINAIYFKDAYKFSFTNSENATIKSESSSANANGIVYGEDSSGNALYSNFYNSGLISVKAEGNSKVASGFNVTYSNISALYTYNQKTGELTVESTNGNAYGLEFNDSSSNSYDWVLFGNRGDVNITSTNSDAYGVYSLATFTNSTFGNYLETTATFDVIGQNATGFEIGTLDNSTIVNKGTMTIEATNGNAIGIDLDKFLTGATIDNSGTLTVKSTPYDQNSYARAIDLTDNTGGGTIENSGTINAYINNKLDTKAYSLYVISTTDVNITNTSTGILNGNIILDKGTFTNNGKISLPYNATNASIDTFVNKGTGTLEIGLETDGTTTTNSKLLITNATFEDGSTINVNVLNTSTNADSLIGTTLQGVISSPNQIDVQGKLNITDNSALLNFEYELSSGSSYDLNLIGIEAKTIFDSAVLGGAQGSTKNSAKKLQEIKDAGTYSAMDSVFTALNALSTDAEVAQKIEETTPQTATSSVSASNHVSQGISGIVTQRQNVNLGGGLSGGNSGDEMFVEKNIWFKPYGSIGSQKDKDGINGFDINTYGLAFGVDGEYEENQTFGLGFFYTNANVDVNNVQQSSDLDVYSLVAYGSNPIIDDKTKFMYQVGYSLQKNKSSRLVTLTSATASADYTSKTASLDLKVLRDYKINDDLLMQPMVSSTYRHFSNPSYSETGAGALNLDVQSFTTTELLLGVGTMAHYKLNDDSKIIANVNVDYDLHDRTTTVTSSYQGASGVTFDTDGIDNGRVSYDIGVGYENQINDLSNINISYNYQGKGSDYSNNVISAKYTYKF